MRILSYSVCDKLVRYTLLVPAPFNIIPRGISTYTVYISKLKGSTSSPASPSFPFTHSTSAARGHIARIGLVQQMSISRLSVSGLLRGNFLFNIYYYINNKES